MIDYKGIIDELDDEKVKNLLNQMNIPFIDKGDFLVMPTVCHHDDTEEASYKLYYYKNTKFFMCYSECGGMNIFNFLKHYYEVRNINYNWYTDILNVITDCSNYNITQTAVAYKSVKDLYQPEDVRPLPSYDDTVLDCFVKYYPPEWLREGITKEAMDKFNIKFSISQNKIIIPHYDIDNRLVGIRGRAMNPEEIEIIGKYAPIQIENKWYSHPLSLNLYGLNVNKENIKKYGICFLFEGEKSVLIMDSFKRPNCAVAVCGSNFNKYALRILMRSCHPKNIVICFDKEQTGNGDKYFNKLKKICDNYSLYANFSFIYDTKNLLDMKDSPVDKGEEIFEKLLERRVIVK